MENVAKWMCFVVIVLMLFINSGCRRYKGELFEEVANNETAFVIELEGQEQVKLDSLELLKANQVSARRIQIPRRWRKTGRMYFDGEWIPTVRVIKVNRAPVTREWDSDSSVGTSVRDQGIWAESKDSVGFSIGFNATARIDETDAAIFLYHFPNGKLSDIMDNQIRAEIQSVSSEVALKYNMDELREQKDEIIKEVREKVMPFFKKSGITITTIGMFGGFTYENKEIQDAIDAVFVSQQERFSTEAQMRAQVDRNKRVVMEAEANAQAAIEKARGQAESVKIQAEAEAARIRMIAEAAEEANRSPVFIQLKMIEAFESAIAKWQGQIPNQLWMMGGKPDLGGIIIDAKENLSSKPIEEIKR